MGCGSSTTSILVPQGKKIIMFGSEGSGKTSILYQVTKNMSVSAIQTIGHNAEYLQVGKEKFVLYDIGAKNLNLSKIDHLLKSSIALAFVIDSSNPNASVFKQSTELFKQISKSPLLEGLPIAICLNKQDMEEKIFIDEEVVERNYGLDQLEKTPFKIFKISSKTKLNIEDPFKWIAQQKLLPNRQQKKQNQKKILPSPQELLTSSNTQTEIKGNTLPYSNRDNN